MNTTLHNIVENTSVDKTQLDGYQELKLITFYHDAECHPIVGPIPITRDTEVVLSLWIPSLEPEARHSRDFTSIWIKERRMILFAGQLWQQFRAKRAALAPIDAERALEKASKASGYQMFEQN